MVEYNHFSDLIRVKARREIKKAVTQAIIPPASISAISKGVIPSGKLIEIFDNSKGHKKEIVIPSILPLAKRTKSP
jgi:hypothetical protein